ncbi:helix-turn-helix transcriptional regulator [Kitasatospora sp. NPDC085879]|uniref:helix-turn-helix domain-containing protein n=1 Tax=Kitasatospora sp. NPDC085879 TaxID=3154769 RepID=UPI003432A1D0
MARRPRPVDPADGPVQAFAHDLRLVRERAGNPTYRVLAERAGFGATTLSDAAGGVRLPSLEVTQAYVGACGGNVDEWTRRWNDLDRDLARGATAPAPERAAEEPADRTAPESAPGQDVLAGRSAPAASAAAPSAVSSAATLLPEPPQELSPTETVRGGWRPPRWTTVGTATLLALTAVLALVALRTGGFGRNRNVAQSSLTPGASAGPTASGSVGCPAADTSPTALFSGTTYNASTRLRAGASLSADVVLQVPSGCQLALTGFCLGDVVIDSTSGSPDMRWFKIATGGYVSSSVVHGNPPAVIQPTDCPDAVAPPASITLAVAPRSGEPGHYELRATGSHLGIVGYAAYVPRAGSSTPQWQQLGMSSDAGAGFVAIWRPATPADNADAQVAVQVVAVACFGGDGPSTISDQRLVSRGATGALPVAELNDAELTRARKAACRYPDTNHG